MPTTAWRLPGTVVNTGGWTSPDNIKVVDGNFASKATSGGQATGIIRATNFGFTNSDIPLGSTIVGIEVRGAISYSGPADADSSSLYIQTTAGTNTGANKASSWSPVSGTKTAGGASDMWSASVSDAQAISSEFSVEWNAYNTGEDSSTTVYIGSIELRFHYTAPPPTITSVHPNVAPAGGNTLVTVTGTNLASVTDGTFAGASLILQGITVVSSTQLTFRTNQANEGLYDLVINNPSGGTVTKTNAIRLVGASGIHESMGNRVREFASVTGTGAIGLTGAYSTSHVRFRSKCPEFSIVKYMIVNSNGEYEVGIGTFSTGPTTDVVARDFVEESSNGNATVSFSSGTKDIILCETAGSVNAGMDYRNILENASMTFWQRQVPITEKSLADGEYGPDRWYVLSQTANVGAYRVDASRPYLFQASAALIKQTNATAQRIGIAQRVWSYESVGLRGKYARIQASFYSNKSTVSALTVRWAVLEWTGTADSVTRDPVLSWTSTTFTPGNFFLASNYNVIGTGSLTLAAGVSTGSISAVTQNPFGQSLNNVVVMFWTDSAIAQNQELHVFAPMLIDDIYPRQWKKPNWSQELSGCKASYGKSYLLDVAPGTSSVYSGVRQFVGFTGSYNQTSFEHRSTMRKSPTLTVYSPATGTSGKCRQYPADTDLNMSTEHVSAEVFSVYTPTAPASTQTLSFQWTADADQ